MTTIDPIALPHIRDLCAAVDANDDNVLPILADALEEVGDPRAEGLRLFAHRPAAERECRPCRTAGGWSWRDRGDIGALAAPVFARVIALGTGCRQYSDAIEYRTRSAAYLALALALALTEARQ